MEIPVSVPSRGQTDLFKKHSYSERILDAIYIYIYIYIYPALQGHDVIQIQSFKWSLTVSNFEFSFSYNGCLNKAKELCLPFYLPITGGRMKGISSISSAISLVQV